MLTDEDQVIFNSTAAVADSDGARLFTAYRSILQLDQVPTGEVDDETGDPVMRDYTDEEVWAMFCGGILRGVIANIQNEERAAAERVAAQAPPIEFTPVEEVSPNA